MSDRFPSLLLVVNIAEIVFSSNVRVNFEKWGITEKIILCFYTYLNLRALTHNQKGVVGID